MSHDLLLQLLIATVAVASSVLLHLGGLSALLILLRIHRLLPLKLPRGLDQALILIGVGFGLFALHTIEIWSYAMLYWHLPVRINFEEALYFSTVTYATIGYGDFTLPREWRILGAIEGANGVILLGWSTAFFVSVVARLRALEHDWLEIPARDPARGGDISKRAGDGEGRR